MLTVAGKIKHSNRDEFSPVRDKFIDFHEREFRRAAEFDRAMRHNVGVDKEKIAEEEKASKSRKKAA